MKVKITENLKVNSYFMQPFQRNFINLAIARGALKFGRFELKSGRISPYFFNAGTFSTGSDLAIIGQCYAEAIVANDIQFDILFGPAYKGIPLAASIAVALYQKHGIDKPYCFNRKEAKAHGEGGALVGAALQGKALIVDDVITAGTAIREVVSIITENHALVAATLVGLDRKERAVQGQTSAVEEIENTHGFKVLSIIDINSIITYLETDKTLKEHLKAVLEYRREYGTD